MDMKKIIYNVLSCPIKFYRNIYIPEFSHVGEPPKEWITDFDEASDLIYNYLNDNSPCLIGRFGSVEFMCMENFMKKKHPFWFLRNYFPFWVDSSITRSMKENAGFFTDESYRGYSKFADLYFESGKQVDVLACWFKNQQYIEKDMNYKLCWILSIEPYWSKKPWSRALQGKKVLIVHPFAESIEYQYKKRELLFSNPNVLPEFASLTVIKAIQSIGGKADGFKDWFDALDHMKRQIEKVDYDIALIGCGAYGLPLAAHCKLQGKKVVHLGGALQLLFGIRGARWENDYPKHGRIGTDYPCLLSNPNWIRPLENEKCKNYQKVEGGCYW